MTDLLKRLREAYAEHIPQWSILKEAADALESAGELPEEDEHQKTDARLTYGNHSGELINKYRTAYSALAARLYRSDEMWKEWQEKCVASEGELSRTLKLSEGVNVACAEYRKLLKQADSRIAELEQKFSVIYDGNAVYAEMSVHAHARTSPENVSDTLDSVNRIWKQLSTDKGEG